MWNGFFDTIKGLNRQAKEYLIRKLKVASRAGVALISPVPAFAVKEIINNFGPNGIPIAYILLLFVAVFLIMVWYGVFQIVIVTILNTLDDAD